MRNMDSSGPSKFLGKQFRSFYRMSLDHIRSVPQGRLTFKRDNAFHKELRRRVDDYFRNSDRSPRDCPAMYLKTAIILAAFSGFYSLLVFVAGSWWQAL